MQVTITPPPGGIAGTTPAPPSKSQTIRALFIASLAPGTSHIRTPLVSSDTESAARACRALGAHIEHTGTTYTVTARPPTSAAPTAAPTPSPSPSPPTVVDIGNSGTSMYIAAAVAALSARDTILDGDAQSRTRPIAPLVHALRALGARITPPDTDNESTALTHIPLKIRGPLRGGTVSIACPTSQYLTALLLAAPLGQDTTSITVTTLNEHPYIDMTLQWLDSQSIHYTREKYDRFVIPGNQSYRPFDSSIEGDYSSAAFLLVAAALTARAPQGVTVTNLQETSTQADITIVDILAAMGTDIAHTGKNSVTLAPPAPGSASTTGLRPIERDLNAAPDLLPILMVACCYAHGTSRLYNIAHARIKESDRITVMATELRKMGANITEYPDQVHITGTPQGMRGALLASHGDHRVAMSLTVAALAAIGPSTIDDAACVAITFPDFFAIIEKLSTGKSIEYTAPPVK